MGRGMIAAPSAFLSLRKLLEDRHPVVPNYMKPVRYDARKLERIIGAQALTPYATGIVRTLDWLAAKNP
jgi:hypothetical protein